MKLILIAGVFNAGAAMAFSVDQNLFTIIAVLVSTAGVVLTTVNWIDKRIEKRMILGLAPILVELENLKKLLNHKK